jgi:hypothetical protein
VAGRQSGGLSRRGGLAAGGDHLANFGFAKASRRARQTAP